MTKTTAVGPVTREEHFRLLNEYHTTPEWKEGRYDFAALVGKRWEIDRDLFWYFLEIMPPVRWTHTLCGESFFISEALTGNIHSKYIREGDRYFHEHAILEGGRRG